MNNSYQICTRCIMDTTDPNIEFDENGVCNHCRQYDKLAEKHLFTNGIGKKKLDQITFKIKQRGKDKEYDCIMGISGGVDSTYTAYIAKKYNLRPLCVHLDNGWNSELAVSNVENIVKKLGFDLQTYVIDWEEFKDLQLSFMKAQVVDIEMLTDHAITAILYNLADKMGIKYILSGGNIVTEAIMPTSWTHRKSDLKNIRSIQKKYGAKKITKFPTASTLKIEFWYKNVKDIKMVNVLNYVPYVQKNVMTIIENELGWKYYGGKHYESIFTRFYQAYILPNKFDIDKRKAHLSTLICSEQITRPEALEYITNDSYDSTMLVGDKDFVLKKLNLSENDFEEYMKTPPKSHFDYPSDNTIIEVLSKLKKIIGKVVTSKHSNQC